MEVSAVHTHTHTIKTLLSERARVCVSVRRIETHLQEGRLLQHAEKLGEIIAHLFIHSTHQTDLSHGTGAVRPVRVTPLNLHQTPTQTYDTK